MIKKIKQTFIPGSPYMRFFLTIMVTGLAYGLYKGVIDNYLAEIVHLGELGRGVMEFFRELPGLALILILAAFYTFSAEKFYKMGAIIMLFGMAMLFVVPANRALVTIAVCLYSLGEHIQLGMKSTLTLEYSEPAKSGEALGILSAVSQIGTLVGYVIVIIAFMFISGMTAFRTFFGIAAVLTGASMIIAFRIKGESKTDSTGSRFYFRKKFTKFYMLEVFYGARKQVFFTFGPYVLILFYGASTTTISLLFAVTAIAGYFISPLVGKLIDRIGYKIIMISDTLILVIVCFFYGFAHHIFPKDVAFIICCVNYVLDSIISLASMASNVYVRDISDSQEEMKATISTGISVNHMITILIALFGGWIWQSLGIETLFIISAVLGLCNSAYAATIKGKGKYEEKVGV
ncbi:MAG: MFS transporter [Oscillospiraceae bacterium]|nr:MFS transporter [Oscillospiraceae bacterium]